MLINFIYFLIFLILTFVLVIAVKAITRGIEAKENNKLNLSKEKSVENEISNYNEKDLIITNEIKELKKLYDDGIIDEDEFKKAKEKILK
tara:strand:- start:202 stop:471 length:270 start_codon:yes stop_codon:yes gene_type:complete